jgi:ankyrin repeat protein
MSALCLAVDIGNAEALCLLLQTRDDVDINSKDAMGRTTLTITAHPGHVEIVRRLLNQQDICINSRTLQFGLTPLSMAAQKGRHTSVLFLLSREEIDINSKDTDGRTALLWALEKGHESIVRLPQENLSISKARFRRDHCL